MQYKLKSTVILALLVAPVIGHASSIDTSPYHRLNSKLVTVHHNYLRKDFDKLDEIRNDFILEFEAFEKMISSGETRLVNQIQRDDYKMAKSYYSSLTTYYLALREKYGFKNPPKETNPKTEQNSPKEVPLTDKSELIADRVKRPEEFSASASTVPLEKIEWTNTFVEMENPLDEELLERDPPSPIDEDKWSKAWDKYYESLGLKKVAQAPELKSANPKKDHEKIQLEKKKEQEDLDKKIAQAREEKIRKMYQEETAVINEGLERIKVLRENQARFQMNIQKEKMIGPAPVEKATLKKSVIFAHDRLSDDDEDIIIISFPRSNR